MFTIEQSPTFQAPVRFGLPGADGTVQQCSFTGTFRRLNRTQQDELTARAQAENWDDRRLAAEVLTGWGRDVTDLHGTPLPYNSTNLAALLDVGPAADAVLRAYRQAQQDAALGN